MTFAEHSEADIGFTSLNGSFGTKPVLCSDKYQNDSQRATTGGLLLDTELRAAFYRSGIGIHLYVLAWIPSKPSGTAQLIGIQQHSVHHYQARIAQVPNAP
jgi:hypothetical protein